MPDAKKAVVLALSYIDGLRAVDGPTPDRSADLFLECLANQGFIVRRRDGAERVRLKPGPIDQRRISGAQIHSERIELGLSRAQVATRAGIHYGTLAAIESGRSSPHMRTLSTILDALAAARAQVEHEP